MTRTSVPASLRRLLAGRDRHDPHDAAVRLAARLRARDACEYCLLPTTGAFHVDHVIPPSLWQDYVAGRLGGVRPVTGRRGPDHLDNFALCCPFCNVAKGRHVSARTGSRVYRLFDPRRDRWPTFFVFVHGYLFIVGMPGIGEATERALRFNGPRVGGPLEPVTMRRSSALPAGVRAGGRAPPSCDDGAPRADRVPASPTAAPGRARPVRVGRGPGAAPRSRTAPLPASPVPTLWPLPAEPELWAGRRSSLMQP
ncbi:MAG: HNH endonuclease [Dehalococcoidia bacterium]